ncbi:MAG: 3-hydroxy-5-phosphonooxypentane-2,4-dione thiolase [Planctomycetota bacterium]|nr:3-hydroxy-5-phosphonooxypentane-2,4-dione thiolase [Planctomycetota bacterium]
MANLDWGLQSRLSSILKPPDGRCVMLAIDHGYFLGPTTGLERPGETVAPLLPHADALMLTRGVLRNCIDPASAPPIVLRVSGGASILGELSNEEITVSMDDAVRLNAAAVAVSIFVGAEHEKQTLTNLAALVDEGIDAGVPVLAVTAVGKEMTRDARYLGLCCRIAAELGAQIVKTYMCEGFEEIVGSCPVPIVVAGGKKIPEADALKLAHDAVTRGATGVDMGRNIFQSENPAAMIHAVRSVVHDGRSPQDAYDLYRSL